MEVPRLASLAIFCTFLCMIGGGSSVPLKISPKDKQYFGLEELIPSNPRFAQRGFNGTWISDQQFLYTKRGEDGFWSFDLTTKESTLFIGKPTMDLLNTTDLKLSPDKKFLLARSDPQTGFRYSSTARFALYDIANNATYLIADHEPLQYCTYGGKDHSVGFVLNNDVYYLEDAAESLAHKRLTEDGIPGVIYNGVPDWVYEEEVFASGSTMWFSEDGSYLSIASFVDTNVDVALYFTYGEPGSIDDQYPTLNQLRYPKVGTKNPDVKLRVINLKNPVVNWITLAPPPIGKDADDIILGAVTWASANEVSALWLNRRQNNATIVICDANTGECKQEVDRREPNGWIEVTIPMFHDNSFVDIEPVAQGPDNTDQWYHVVKYTIGNKTPLPLSNGKRTVIAILGWNVDLDKVYYLSTVENEPWQRHLWVGGSKTECISCNLQLTGGEPCRYVSVNMSPGSKSYSIMCQGSAPGNVSLFDATDDTPYVSWQDNSELRETIDGYWLPVQMNLKVAVGGNFQAAVKLFLPPELDLADSNTNYPMIVNIYTGPNSARVTDTFGLGYQTYISTNRSIIYCYIDGRGSGLKGKDMLFTINNRLGTDEVQDVIDVTAELTNMFSWIDKTKIGIWGWSYGGYSTGMALTKDSADVFKCGVSVAPVTSWLYYDTIYTERFMGTPEDNPLGYENGDLTKRANLLRGKNFLLMHGNADDNVHYQNAMALARVLQLEDIPFEQMSYPDEAHGLNGVSRHVYHTIDDFWTRCFA